MPEDLPSGQAECKREGRLRLDALQGAVPSMEEGRQQNAGYLNASAAAERLQRNVNREHFLCTDFLLAFWQVCAFSHVACPTTLRSMLHPYGSAGLAAPALHRNEHGIWESMSRFLS